MLRLLCSALLYWISRTWLIVDREKMHHDPVEFAISDQTSLVVAAALAAIYGIAL